MANTFWILESIDDKKFPYLLTLKKDGNILLRLRVQDRWPGQKGNIFCIREEDNTWYQPIEELERVPVTSLKRFGKRLAVVLDRPKNKRCDFLFLKKRYKTKEGEYEQIFWRTEQALRERRPKIKLTTYTQSNLLITIDINERYPWHFPDSNVKKERLPIGDYALKDSNGIVAVVERKTFENILTEFGRMAAFHQRLSELEAYRHAALVIEANYSDFLNPQKVRFYTSSFTAKAIAELYALHPDLTIVFAGNRKLAREWTCRFFTAINAHEEDVPHPKVSEVINRYGITPETRGGSYYDIKKKIVEDFPFEFTFSMIKDTFPHIPEATIRKVLRDMKKEGIITVHGKGEKSCWKKTDKEINKEDP
jgi:ERCC4-type nuclease